MSHSFKVTVPEKIVIEDSVKQLREGIESEGGKYQFNGKTGSFSIHGVDGDFILNGRDLTINITKKPFLVPYRYIEKLVNDYIS